MLESNSRIKLLTGIPRSGTTLCCHLLNEHSDTVALHEPIDPGLFTTDQSFAVGKISDFAHQSRKTLLERGEAMSKQQFGKIPENPVARMPDGQRRETVTLGDIRVAENLSSSFCLVIKHNALFTALIGQLAKEFELYVLIRNPLAVLASWQSVDLPVARGTIPMGERFDPSLSRELDVADSLLEKQLKILSWFFQRYRGHDRSRILSYESLIDSNGEVLKTISGSTPAQEPDLSAQLKNSGLAATQLRQLSDALIEQPQIYSPFYAKSEIESELKRMLD